MTDIIANAQQLLDGSTPGPWEWIGYDLEQTFEAGGAIVMDATCENPHLGGVVNVEITPEDERLIAAVPELAQALAEEEYQYGVTYIGVSHGGHHVEWVEPTGDSEWDKGTLQLLVKRWKRKGQSPKIVRRRVSPPEVINE